MTEECKTLNMEKDELNLGTVEARHKRLDMIQVYKVLNDRKNVYREDCQNRDYFHL
jgi:hypothetical protein